MVFVDDSNLVDKSETNTACQIMALKYINKNVW